MQQTVEATSVPSRTVEVAAADLPAYIAGLPRLLTENLTVKVSGTTTDAISFYRFYGSARLLISAQEGETASIGAVYVEDCHAAIGLSGLRVQSDTPTFNTLVLISGSTSLRLHNCHILGTKTLDAVNISMGTIYLNECQFTRVNRVLINGYGAVVTVDNCTGSDNVFGIISTGGAVHLMGSTPELLGGSANSRYSGGLIVKADGTLL